MRGESCHLSGRVSLFQLMASLETSDSVNPDRNQVSLARGRRTLFASTFPVAFPLKPEHLIKSFQLPWVAGFVGTDLVSVWICGSSE